MVLPLIWIAGVIAAVGTAAVAVMASDDEDNVRHEPDENEIKRRQEAFEKARLEEQAKERAKQDAILARKDIEGLGEIMEKSLPRWLGSVTLKRNVPSPLGAAMGAALGSMLGGAHASNHHSLSAEQLSGECKGFYPIWEGLHEILQEHVLLEQLTLFANVYRPSFSGYRASLDERLKEIRNVRNEMDAIRSHRARLLKIKSGLNKKGG